MTLHVDAIYEEGVLKPLEPLDLKDQELVSLSIEETSDRARLSEATLFDVLDEVGLVGSVKDAPPDLSTNRKQMERFGKSGG